MEAAGLEVRPAWRIAGAAHQAGRLRGGRAVPGAARTSRRRPCCWNDLVAIGLMNGIARAGLVPGVDISVTGYDDLEEAAIATPALTTVWNGQREVGRRAARALLDRLNGGRRVRPSQELIKPELHVRQSTGKPVGACMTKAEQTAKTVAILVPGDFNDHAVGRIDRTLQAGRIERADPALVTDEIAGTVRGIAAFAGIDAALIDALPNLEIIANFGVGYDSVDAGHAASAGHHGHQHARRADRGGRRHRDRPADQHRARTAARRDTGCATAAGQRKGNYPPEPADLARPPRRHFRHGPHRPGHCPAAGSVRPADRLSQPAPGRGPGLRSTIRR